MPQYGMNTSPKCLVNVSSQNGITITVDFTEYDVLLIVIMNEVKNLNKLL